MTEIEKQNLTLVVKEILRQAKVQLDTTGLRETHSKIMRDLEQKPSSLFQAELMAIPLQILDVISGYEERLHGMQELVDHIQEAPASELNMEDISPRLKKLLQP